jgi:hypothetical protein
VSAKIERVDLIRRAGNMTTTWEAEWDDGCIVVSRTHTTYQGARVVRRNEVAAKCPEHRMPA